MFDPRESATLRGWTFYRSDFHGRECWVANRFGVSMNAHSRAAIVNMILKRGERYV